MKHKKLGIWLAPGGHLEENELPHVGAEREFWEETGIRVRAVSSHPLLEGTENSSYYPVPFAVNVHWISKEIYQRRLRSEHPEERVTDEVWKLGCEKHLSFVYLVEAEGDVEFAQNVEETDGIGWFRQKDLKDLETIEEIRREATWVLAHTL